MALGVLAVLAAGTAVAGEFDDYDFSLRLPAALSRFSSYGDVAGTGGASAASPWSSSANPASAAWLPNPGTLGLSLSPQYSGICFADGTWLHVASESAVVDSRSAGVFQPTLAQVQTPMAGRATGWTSIMTCSTTA